MHIPQHFEMQEDETLAFVQRIGVGHLITAPNSSIQSTLLPFQIHISESKLVVRAHISRANPHHKSMGNSDALLIVSGPDAYVSPANYPTKADGGRAVPTWNYPIAHLRGIIRTFNDPDQLLADVAALSNMHEASQPHPWSVDDAPKEYIDNLIKGIVGIEIVVSSIEGKAKLSQNRPEIDRTTVRDVFLNGSSREHLVGEMMA